MLVAVRVPRAAAFWTLLSMSVLLSSFADARARAEPPGLRDRDSAIRGGPISKPRDFMTRGPLSALRAGTLSLRTSTTTISNVPVCAAIYDQLAPVVIQDGGGGGIVVWTDYRSGLLDIYAQKVNAAGVPQWVKDGVPVCKAPGSQFYPQAVSDGAGGAIVVWQDGRADTTLDIYAQRVNTSGVNQWPNGGVLICSAVNGQRRPALVVDGAGGAVIAWIDDRSLGSDVYVQRINAAGVVQWTSNGVPLCTAPGAQQDLAMATDTQQGAIVVWQDQRGGPAGDIYARRVNEAGAPQWVADGVAVCAAAGAQETPSAVADGAGGAIFAWADQRAGNYDVYSQRVIGTGTVSWTDGGVAVCAATGDQLAPKPCSDGSNGAYLVWQDGRGGATADVYGQRVSDTGVMQWAANGVAVCTAPADQLAPTIFADPTGGAVVAWSDARTGTNGLDVYVQHVNGTGATEWASGGVQLCDAPNTQDQPAVIADGFGGGVVAWRDSRGGGYSDIYCQRVNSSGQVADQCTPPDTLRESVKVPTAFPQNYKLFHNVTSGGFDIFRWAGVGVRGAPGDDWDIEVYDQGTFGLNPYPTCFGGALAGSYGSSGVDFVISNFNDFHTPPGVYGVRPYRFSGGGSADIEFDGGFNTIPLASTAKPDSVVSPPGWTGVLDVYDVGLTAGVTYTFDLTHDPGGDIRVFLFTSYGALDYYYVVPRSARVMESNARWGIYTAPSTEYYGVAVTNETGAPCAYVLKVWSTTPVGVGDRPPSPATVLSSITPNPSQGDAQIQFALREAGEVSFHVMDMAGRVVASIPARPWDAGSWSVNWNGRSSGGAPLSPGIYFVQMKVNGQRVGLGRLALVR